MLPARLRSSLTRATRLLFIAVSYRFVVRSIKGQPAKTTPALWSYPRSGATSRITRIRAGRHRPVGESAIFLPRQKPDRDWLPRDEDAQVLTRGFLTLRTMGSQQGLPSSHPVQRQRRTDQGAKRKWGGRPHCSSPTRHGISSLFGAPPIQVGPNLQQGERSEDRRGFAVVGSPSGETSRKKGQALPLQTPKTGQLTGPVSL